MNTKFKNKFSYFGTGSLLYAIFYTFCLYHNASGITYPFFVIGTLFYFFFSIQKLGVPYKKDNIFYMISLLLLGISNCLTTSSQLLFMNKCGIFLLSFFLMMHTIYNDREWNLPKYLSALFQTIGTCLSCVLFLRPFSDLMSFFHAHNQENSMKNVEHTDNQSETKCNIPEKKSYILPVLAGFTITIPLLFIVTALLCSADAVFANIIKRIFDCFNLTSAFQILFFIVAVFFCSYAVFAALCMKNVSEQMEDRRTFEPVIAIIMTAALSIVYLMFSGIQIVYLFMGKLQLPESYTYSSYAREGFFQLLVVCILNLLLALVCLHLFRENIVLKLILTLISGCTYIMILSSALRMIMYISQYHLTFLRFFVLWSLAVIFFLISGVTIFIYNRRFPLFTYGMVIVTVLYIGLSFSHPDYWIARYDLKAAYSNDSNSYDSYDNTWYLSTLSSDAAPILLNEKTNPYFTSIENLYSEDSINSEDTLDVNNDLWLRNYYKKIKSQAQDMHARNFNFSLFRAMQIYENM